MFALDTETTGVDLKHGAKPFLVTTCDDHDSQLYWEWFVNPMTREPEIPEGDLDEIAERLSNNEPIVLHNGKFDVSALTTIRKEFGEGWNWGNTHDTLIMAHLLRSNRKKDLTSLALDWIGVDIEPYEKRLEEAVKECRRQVARRDFISDHGEFAIAKAGRIDMPSCKEQTWRYDYWLPRAVARTLDLPVPKESCEHTYGQDWVCPKCEGHQFWTVLRDYANLDSDCTIHVYKALSQEIEQRGLTKIYQTRLKLPAIVYRMEQDGVTANKHRLEKLVKEYTEESKASGETCVSIAATYTHKSTDPAGSLFDDQPYDLVLPKNGVNNSLRTFCFEVMGLERLYSSKAKTEAPTLDAKVAIPHYLVTLQPNSRELKFIEKLSDKRMYDTALSYLESYRKFWMPDPSDKSSILYILFPTLNITGSDTLRFSMQNPNLQQVSKKEKVNLRYMLGPSAGREWYSFDAKNIEARLPAYASGEQELIRLYENADDPPYYGSAHLLNFHTVYTDIWEAALAEVGFEKVGPYCKKKYAATWYQYCKNGGFAVQYGAVEKANGWGTADRAFHKQYAHKLLKQRFSKLEALNQKCIRFATKHGYVETMPDKTVDPNHGYPLMCTRTERGYILETVPLNYYIQGSAMWWTGKAMIRVQEFFDRLNRGEVFVGKTWPGSYRIALQVHDELVTDMPRGPRRPGQPPYAYNLPVTREVRRLMELGGDDFGYPTPVGCEHHLESWADGNTVAF